MGGLLRHLARAALQVPPKAFTATSAALVFFFFFFTLVAGPRRSFSFQLSEKRVFHGTRQHPLRQRYSLLNLFQPREGS